MDARANPVTVRRRLLGSFGASSLGPIASIFINLVNIPVMVRFWGVHLLGEWLLITTIPAYLLLTDLGFGNVSSSDMTLRLHAGDRDGAIETFQSTAVVVLSISLFFGVALSALILLTPFYRYLHIAVMTPAEARTTALFLCINSLLAIQWTYLTAAFKCVGKFALSQLSMNVVRLLEGVSVFILLVSHAGPVGLAMVMTGISVIGTLWLIVLKRHLIPWLPLGIKHARRDRVRELFRPAIAYLAFPTGSAISLQGMTTLVGALLGPVAVAVFNPMRTLARASLQLSEAVKISVLPELSAAMGAQNWILARKLHRSACQAAFFLTLLCVGALAIGGKRIFYLWTRHRIIMDVHAFYLLLGVVLLNSAWSASSAAPVAANKHQRVAILYLVFTVGSILVGYPLIKAFGLVGAGIALLASEACMDVIVVKISNDLLSDRWSAFAASMLDFSHFNFPRLRQARSQVTQD
jgi:O-antigen/teichoic acid export membrane protein